MIDQSVDGTAAGGAPDAARLSGANLAGADLCGADLSGAQLAGANLRAANLFGATFAGASFDDVVYDRETRWPAGFAPAPYRRLERDPSPPEPGPEPVVPSPTGLAEVRFAA